eukprot:2164598-Rhodomonas_salina.1
MRTFYIHLADLDPGDSGSELAEPQCSKGDEAAFVVDAGLRRRAMRCNAMQCSAKQCELRCEMLCETRCGAWRGALRRCGEQR